MPHSHSRCAESGDSHNHSGFDHRDVVFPAPRCENNYLLNVFQPVTVTPHRPQRCCCTVPISTWHFTAESSTLVSAKEEGVKVAAKGKYRAEGGNVMGGRLRQSGQDTTWTSLMRWYVHTRRRTALFSSSCCLHPASFLPSPPSSKSTSTSPSYRRNWVGSRTILSAWGLQHRSVMLTGTLQPRKSWYWSMLSISLDKVRV